ncbi:hypothetical protein LTR37_021208 [Vermiconidia calcicola]|uniref:Uncharacterized protein n=1 Tax=Vermiconidia calcicola TaxID=1690605 RepID=A0ACC3M984_9PEZI|nr:hypothetical protein LTR37_021208 [Vermiconidia calcicola]
MHPYSFDIEIVPEKELKKFREGAVNDDAVSTASMNTETEEKNYQERSRLRERMMDPLNFSDEESIGTCEDENNPNCRCDACRAAASAFGDSLSNEESDVEDEDEDGSVDDDDNSDADDESTSALEDGEEATEDEEEETESQSDDQSSSATSIGVRTIRALSFCLFKTRYRYPLV